MIDNRTRFEENGAGCVPEIEGESDDDDDDDDNDGSNAAEKGGGLTTSLDARRGFFLLRN